MTDEPSVTDLLAEVRNELRVARTIPSTAIVLRQRAVNQAVDYILSDPRFDNAARQSSQWANPDCGAPGGDP